VQIFNKASFIILIMFFIATFSYCKKNNPQIAQAAMEAMPQQLQIENLSFCKVRTQSILLF